MAKNCIFQLQPDTLTESLIAHGDHTSDREPNNDTDKTKFLSQISRCLLFLHEENIACEQLSASKVHFRKTLFSNPTGFESEKQNAKSKKEKDILSLAGVYRHFLENDFGLHPDFNLALDLINELEKKTVLRIEDVLKHPFHWSDFQKVYFMCEAVGFVDAKYEQARGNQEKAKILQTHGMSDGNGFSENIKSLLELNKKEMKLIHANQMKIQESMREPFTKYLISDLYFKTKSAKETPFFGLLKFFRNRYVHRYEDKKIVKMCFVSYPTGFLEFFTSRFPKLFTHVYRNMKKYMFQGGNYSEFPLDEFFHRPSHYVSLRVGSGDVDEFSEATNDKHIGNSLMIKN